MHRVDGQDYAAGNLFRAGNPLTGEQATELTADVLNALQQEIAHVVEAEGLALVKVDNTQLHQAIVLAIARVAVPYIAAARGPRYVAAAAALTPGTVLVDSFAASFVLTLPAAPVLGDAIELIDARATWGTNPVTIARNGNNIEGLAQDLLLNVSDQRLIVWFNDTEWRLN